MVRERKRDTNVRVKESYRHDCHGVALAITFCNQRFECPFTNPEADVAKPTAPLTIHSIYKNIIQPKQLPLAMGNPINKSENSSVK